MSIIKEQAKKAKAASVGLSLLSTEEKNRILSEMALALEKGKDKILKANAVDMKAAEKKGMRASMQDRLRLSAERIEAMATGLRQVADLPDPTGLIQGGKTLPNGLKIEKISVPLGVLAIIYEARPNVTADAVALGIKSGNAVILKGGSEALNSNKALAEILAEAGKKAGMPEGSLEFIDSTEHGAVAEVIRLSGIVDVVIPRGGAGLINMVVENSSVPVIQTGVGVCHIYVDKSADFGKAEKIILNAKAQRPSVCNAVETLLIHKEIADDFLPFITASLQAEGVKVLVEEAGEKILLAKDLKADSIATEEDWSSEYGDLIISVKLVDDVQAAMEHIAIYGTGHSECIISNDYENIHVFQQGVDAAVVYANASTRFTDGFEFGFGAEIGISTQKLHARGPMGLSELTTYKYIVSGRGQVRK